MNQREIERRFVAWRRAGADAERSGTVGDWLLELDRERLVLNPVRQRWYALDAIHDEWVDTGMVPGEAIFVALDGVVGAHRALWAEEVALPLEQRIERVCDRVVVLLDGELYGPMEAAQIQALAAERPGSSLHFWSPRDPAWRAVPT
jgi:hypothetical protein